MAELGQTNDPKALIPGEPGTVNNTALELRDYGDLLALAGQGLQRIDTSAGWTGSAADAFRNVFHGQPGKWIQAGDTFHEAAAALHSYADTLEWAQAQAAEAINLWAAGAAHHHAAQSLLDAARSTVASAGDTADATVGKARDLAPPKPSLWSEITSDAGSFLSGAGHTLESVSEGFVNDVASVGNAALHDPGHVLETLGGIGLTVLSGGGEVGGLALDATGVGAVVGVPVNVLSAAGITVGVGLTSVGIAGILGDAAGPDRVGIMHSESASDSGGPPPRSYSSNVGKIAQQTGYTPKQINDAIHGVKGQGGWRGLGVNKNPDVIVDTTTGEVYVKTQDGDPSDDSIGNIYDYLPEE
jgi:exonuclease VII small subunit